MRVITIANEKGGVGKTTTTVNLAAALGSTGSQVLVIEEHVDRGGNFSRTTLIDRGQDPRRFDQHKVWDPRPTRHECFRGFDLPGVVPCDKAHQHVRVNGAHGAP